MHSPERKIEFGMHASKRGTHEGKGEGVLQVSVIINYEINHASYPKPLQMVVSGVDLRFYTQEEFRPSPLVRS
jgi:hypothetical protein